MSSRQKIKSIAISLVYSSLEAVVQYRSIARTLALHGTPTCLSLYTIHTSIYLCIKALHYISLGPPSLLFVYLVFIILLHAARRAMAAVVGFLHNPFSLAQADRIGHSRTPNIGPSSLVPGFTLAPIRQSRKTA